MAGQSGPDWQTLAASVRDVWLGNDVPKVLEKLRESSLSSSQLLQLGLADVNGILPDKKGFSKMSFESLQVSIRRRRLDLQLRVPEGLGACVFFTAPHTMLLNRDGDSDHTMESYTGTLAVRFAEEVGGSCATWAQHERDRISALGAADETNRDPNYLRLEERQTSPWFFALHTARSLAACSNAGRPGLHVDLHGMRGPSDDPPMPERSDCDVGTRAMEASHGATAAAAFQAQLDEHLGPVLREMGMELTHNKTFGGCWGHGRSSLGQLSTDAALWAGATPQAQAAPPFSHAAQVEMSLKLRLTLTNSAKLRSEFARALVAAFAATSV